MDKSAPLLHHLSGKARDLGVAGRVRIVPADLDAAWPAIGSVDLAWASSSLHHMADPDRVLAEVFGAIRPGGLLAVAELGSFPRFLADATPGSPRARSTLPRRPGRIRADEVPHMGSDWGALLTKTGFTIEAERTFTIDLDSPAARRHRPLRPGVPAAHPARPRRPDERRRPGRARHPDRQRRTR